jgi:hypothetical protein
MSRKSRPFTRPLSFGETERQYMNVFWIYTILHCASQQNTGYLRNIRLLRRLIIFKRREKMYMIASLILMKGLLHKIDIKKRLGYVNRLSSHKFSNSASLYGEKLIIYRSLGGITYVGISECGSNIFVAKYFLYYP